MSVARSLWIVGDRVEQPEPIPQCSINIDTHFINRTVGMVVSGGGGGGGGVIVRRKVVVVHSACRVLFFP